MAETTALSAELREGIRRVGEADIVVGIPSFRNAGTIGHVATVAAEGLRRHFGDARVAIVNADGGSEDGTTAAWLMSGGAVSSTPFYGSTAGWTLIGNGDFDGNGATDLLSPVCSF